MYDRPFTHRPFNRCLPLIAAALALLTLGAAPAPAAQVCAVDMDAVDAALAKLEQNYGDVRASIDCPGTANLNRSIICEKPELAKMMRLAEMASVYAYENATGTETDHQAPPDHFLDLAHDVTECGPGDIDCLCNLITAQTNDALGGTSPYPQ